MVLRLPAPPDELLEVATIAVLHDDENLCLLLVNDSIVVLDDVGVTQFAQNVYFRNYLLLLLLAHYTVIQLLPN